MSLFRAQLGLALTIGFVASAQGQEDWSRRFHSGLKWERPPRVEPGECGAPPSDAIVLFDGTDLSAWEGGDRWRIEDGVAIVRGGTIETKQPFGSMHLHLEWSAPADVRGRGQGRGNSGVYIMGLYEVQILDSYHREDESYIDGMAGSVYRETPPLANPIRPPGEWNVYDLIFTAPEFADDGELVSPAYVTLLFNGVLVHNHTEVWGGTQSNRMPVYKKHPKKLPLELQDHGNPVRFRNIWVREIEPLPNERVHEPMLKPAG